MIATKSSTQITKEPLEEFFTQLGRPCSVPLILALGERAHNAGIHELRRTIGTRVGRTTSESTVTKCLADLTELGLVQRTDHAESPPKAGYTLTYVGREIYRHILQIRRWAELTSDGTDIVENNVSAR